MRLSTSSTRTILTIKPTNPLVAAGGQTRKRARQTGAKLLAVGERNRTLLGQLVAHVDQKAIHDGSVGLGLIVGYSCFGGCDCMD